MNRRGKEADRDDVLAFEPTGDIFFDVDLEITGGTGRFKGATGHAEAAGRANIFTRTFGIELTGRIATVGSSKRQ